MAADELARERALAFLAADVAACGIGIALEDAGVGRVTVSATVTPQMINGGDMAHGGYLFMLADAAFSIACNTYPDGLSVARSGSIEFVRPAVEGDELVATATERSRTGRDGIYDVSVTRRADGTVVAEMRGHSRLLHGRR
jgi:acyl-CoA thioesterase